MPVSSVGPDIAEAAEALQPYTVELRRDIHQYPELGLQLPRTQQVVLDALTGLDLDITLGESTTSVVADLDTGRPGPTILLRGDMDALPLQEDADLPFRSEREGHMHACGHDAHTAMLASAARLLSDNRDQLRGRVRFMFQPGEEGFHGARYMIEEGVLEGVDQAFAIHVIAPMPSGLFFSKAGPVMASADKFELTIRGAGGHASMPAQCIDPVPAAAATVLSLHAMVGRSTAATDPAVLTVARMTAGTTNNIIPETAELEGTIRTFNETTRDLLTERLERVAEHTAAAHGCTCETVIDRGYPVTSNHETEVARAEAVSGELFGAEVFHRMSEGVMGAEDFSYVLNEVPGLMAFLGVCPPEIPPEEAHPNHSNYMTVHEPAMARGVAMYAAMAVDALTN